MVGAIWGLRGFGGLLSLFWLVGLAAGAVHPLGLLLALLIVAVLTWFVASLGAYTSLISRTTSRALTGTLVILLFLNCGYLGVLYPIVLVFGDPSQWRYRIRGMHARHRVVVTVRLSFGARVDPGTRVTGIAPTSCVRRRLCEHRPDRLRGCLRVF